VNGVLDAFFALIWSGAISVFSAGTAFVLGAEGSGRRDVETGRKNPCRAGARGMIYIVMAFENARRSAYECMARFSTANDRLYAALFIYILTAIVIIELLQ